MFLESTVRHRVYDEELHDCGVSGMSDRVDYIPAEEGDDEDRIQALASLGVSTAAFTDELRAPLMGAVMCAKALQQPDQTQDRVAEYAASLVAALERMQRTLDALEATCDCDRTRPRALSARALAERCVRRTLAAASTTHAHLTLRLNARRAEIHADSADAERALFHVVAVSLERAAEGAEVVLETRTRGDFMGFFVRQLDLLRSPAQFTEMDERVPLATARHLAERNGGSLEVKAHRVEGVVLWLPLQKLEEPTPTGPRLVSTADDG